jgi:hypothetical protein
VLVLVDHHLHAWCSSGYVEGLVPFAFLDVCFGAVDRLECRRRADG